MTLVASALAGGDCIDDADVLRTGRTAGALGCVVKAPSTLGTFLRSFRWGHVRQLDRVGRELLARAWAAGAGPGDVPLTIDLDSTIGETYDLAKEGTLRQQNRYPTQVVASNRGGDRVGGGISKMAKQELLATIRDRYRSSSKKDKSRILDEFIAVTGHHRKHGIRLLGKPDDDEGTAHSVRGRRIYN